MAEGIFIWSVGVALMGIVLFLARIPETPAAVAALLWPISVPLGIVYSGILTVAWMVFNLGKFLYHLTERLERVPEKLKGEE